MLSRPKLRTACEPLVNSAKQFWPSALKTKGFIMVSSLLRYGIHSVRTNTAGEYLDGRHNLRCYLRVVCHFSFQILNNKNKMTVHKQTKWAILQRVKHLLKIESNHWVCKYSFCGTNNQSIMYVCTSINQCALVDSISLTTSWISARIGSISCRRPKIASNYELINQ